MLKLLYSAELKQKLNQEIYSKFYCSQDGECKYFSVCKKRLRNKIPKHKCDRVRIGKNYGQPGIPKIMCLGIEGICKNEQLNERQVLQDFLPPSKDASNPHYNGVIYVLKYILSHYLKDCQKPDPKICKNDGNKNSNITDLFVLSNFYKCAFVPADDPEKTTALSHTKGMRMHCQEILMEEIRIIKPDVLIVQSAQWPNGLWQNMKDRFHFENAVLGFGKNEETSVFMGDIDRQPMILVCTYHGAYRKFKNREYIETELNPVLDKAIELLGSH